MTEYQQKQLRKSIYIPLCCRGKVTCLHSGPLSGDAELGAMIGNNKLDVTDAYQLLTKISKSRSISNDEKEKVDINEDGNVDVTDAYLQLKLISEM